MFMILYPKTTDFHPIFLQVAIPNSLPPTVTNESVSKDEEDKQENLIVDVSFHSE